MITSQDKFIVHDNERTVKALGRVLLIIIVPILLKSMITQLIFVMTIIKPQQMWRNSKQPSTPVFRILFQCMSFSHSGLLSSLPHSLSTFSTTCVALFIAKRTSTSLSQTGFALSRKKHSSTSNPLGITRSALYLCVTTVPMLSWDNNHLRCIQHISCSPKVCVTFCYVLLYIAWFHKSLSNKIWTAFI